MMKLLPLRGTKDLLPKDFAIYDHIVNTAKNIGKLYAYSQISTPIIEYAKVFDRTLGDDSDIVSKEMYCFLDKSEELIALRPEFTAGIMRAFFSNNLTHQLPLKFFTAGPLFRYDRPQLGRQRQFHQINFEFLGAKGAFTDAETIKLAYDILSSLGITKFKLEINSLGCTESRIEYQKYLLEYLNNYRNKLSNDSLKRLTKNPMRILDSKDAKDQEIILNAPKIDQFYTKSAHKYFNEVLNYLDLMNVKYVINPNLVRGLDYYTHTAFEFVSETEPKLSLLGGGRYDNLGCIMGGMEVPAIGFGAGIERLMLLYQGTIDEVLPVVVIPLSPDQNDKAFLLVDQLRSQSIAAIGNFGGKLNKLIGRASSDGIKYIVIVGEEEVAINRYRLKNLVTRVEEIIDYSSLLEILRIN